MKTLFPFFIATTALVLFIESAFGEGVTNLGNDVFKVYVDTKELNASFPAYPDMDPPFLNKKTIDLKAKEGSVLLKIDIIIDNVSDEKQPFRLGDIQLKADDNNFPFVAAGLASEPLAIEASDLEKTKNTVHFVESRRDTTGGSYRFPKYIFEMPKNSSKLELRYSDSRWFNLDVIKLNSE